MHMVIRAICYADTKKEALSNGKNIINELCGEDKTFDYATFFDEKENGISGKSRWGDLPPVAEATSKEGNKLITDGLNFTKGKFMENMKEIRKAIQKYRDIDIFEEKIMDDKIQVVNALKQEKGKEYELRMFKYLCSCVGQYKGGDIFLYDNDGSGIRNSEQLKRTLTEFNDGKKVWVVSADVHL